MDDTTTPSTPEDLPVILDPQELVDYLVRDPPDYGSEELFTMLVGVGRDHGPYVMAAVHSHGALDQRHAGVVVPLVWSMVEHPLLALETDTWRELFSFAGYTFNGRRRVKPRTPRLLYRGADEAHRAGWSWTEDRQQAQWFADRTIHPTPGRVWQAVVEPARLLARITSTRQGEREWVVDTEGLDISLATWTVSRSPEWPSSRRVRSLPAASVAGEPNRSERGSRVPTLAPRAADVIDRPRPR